MSSSLSTFRDRASVAVEGTATVGVLGTLVVSLMAVGVVEPLASTTAEMVVIGWSSGFLICYAWMAHWLRGQDR